MPTPEEASVKASIDDRSARPASQVLNSAALQTRVSFVGTPSSRPRTGLFCPVGDLAEAPSNLSFYSCWQDECAVDVCHEKSGHSADRVHDAVAEEQPLLTSHEVPASPLAGAALTVAEGARYAMAAAVEAGASRMLDQGLCDKAAACAALTKDSAVDSVPEELSTMGGQCSTEACMTTTQALGAVHRAEKPGTRQTRKAQILLDLQGPQWMVFLTAALAAIMITSLLESTSALYTQKQREVSIAGFQNFQIANPEKVCPKGDPTSPISKCTPLRWACQQKCQRQGITTPIWFLVDTRSIDIELLNLAVADECAFVGSQSSSETKDRLVTVVNNPEISLLAYMYAMPYNATPSQADIASFEAYDIPNNNATSNMTKVIFADVVNNIMDKMTQQNGPKSLGEDNNTLFTGSSYQRKAPPLRGDIIEFLLQNLTAAVDRDGAQYRGYANSTLPPVPPIELSGIDGTILLESTAGTDSGEMPSSFIRLNLRRAIDVSNGTEPECMSAMTKEIMYNRPRAGGSGESLLPKLWDPSDPAPLNLSILAAAYHKEVEPGPLQLSVLSNDTVCDGSVPMRYVQGAVTYVDSLGDVDDDSLTKVLLPIRLSSNYPFSISQCSRLLLLAQRCTAADYCPGDKAVAPSDSALLDSFVEAAKKSNGVAKFIGQDWSYEDLSGLYIGLVAAAITAIATALTALLGLAITYLGSVRQEPL